MNDYIKIRRKKVAMKEYVAPKITECSLDIFELQLLMGCTSTYADADSCD